MDSSSGVSVGSESKHGASASSNTADRFVRRRISDSLARIGVTNLVKRLQPSVLNARLSSSMRDRIGGTSNERWDSKCSASAGWLQISTCS